ncbi:MULTISPECIES: 50S ribosomal protein L25 [unclassified Sedimentibacter]|uniref:50S ribosomal protein L25 n=1 Tax=unclassified Sedimentibacter TaxID=2649220 RepID=UPI0027DEEAFB|nr:50S ribosomal protein L25 [Sedimentibacter sp. MB35-C1]WMJ76137.1 50S ribosomal protein L25 [Sedimentibacter sp. MB35-C1]
MSELGVIKIKKRENTNSRESKKLRKNGFVPASISCKGKDSVSVYLRTDELKKSVNKYGRYALFKLSIENEDTITGMVKDIHYSPIKGELLNVDLQEVSMSEEIKADLPVRLKGVEKLELRKLMALSQLDVIRVKGLPQDIPDEITIDVSNINGIENINVADVDFPKGIVPEINLEQCVISIVEAKRQASVEPEPDEDTESIDA